MSSSKIVHVQTENTPNPNTLKFCVGRILIEGGSLNFTDSKSSESNPLAKALFQIKNVESVMIGRDFITVTKVPCAAWDSLRDEVRRAIETVLLRPEENICSSAACETCGTPIERGSKDSLVVKKIQEILENEIRPALAMDGGDVAFVGYENGIVRVRLQGSCRFCPSAVMTLRLGVEARLKSLIPEVKEVVSV